MSNRPGKFEFIFCRINYLEFLNSTYETEYDLDGKLFREKNIYEFQVVATKCKEFNLSKQ